jgi:hypothetical protein
MLRLHYDNWPKRQVAIFRRSRTGQDPAGPADEIFMDRRLLRQARVALAVATASVLLTAGAGCAGQASIPKANFLAGGNAACQQATGDWDALVKKIPPGPIETREKYVVETLAPALSNLVNQLRSLGAPAGDQEYLESIYADADGEIAQMVDQPSTGLQARLDAPFAAPAARFEAYGLDRCAEL